MFGGGVGSAGGGDGSVGDIMELELGNGIVFDGNTVVEEGDGLGSNERKIPMLPMSPKLISDCGVGWYSGTPKRR